jgi:hypothetical protein
MISGIETIATKTMEQSENLVDGKILDGKELPSVGEISGSTDGLIIEKPDIAFIECTTRIALIEQNTLVASESTQSNNEGTAATETPEKEGLTDEEKAKIKEETGWSDKIVENIQNMKQYEILKGRKEVEINGRKCLIKEDFDLDYTDEDGISNRERIARGLSPLDNDGNKIYLHHLGQKVDSPLVELTYAEHMQGGNDKIWHDKNISTEVHGEDNTWDSDRKDYWSEREKQMDGGNA